MADMEEVKKKMDQDVNAIAKLQKDLKQALQERISLQEKLSEVRVFLFFLFFFFFLFSFFFLRVNVVVSFSFLFLHQRRVRVEEAEAGVDLACTLKQVSTASLR